MKVYMLTDDNKQAVAFHTEKKVIAKYRSDYELTNKVLLHVYLVKQKVAEEYQLFYDLYLVRHGDCYIQRKYLEIAETDYEQVLYDYQYAHDVLMKLMMQEKSNKKRKVLLKADSILQDEIDSINRSVSTISELEERYRTVQDYKHRIYDD